ncbi:DNA-binding protein [Xenorhabdus stockiae]|uniref:DNA-binding protein n=1 Tax=Xenorhabdus TaxID=626 RepID=UPI000C057347|nr:DNA-binding protein [Xenorhabdus sp. KJ12.1]PHM72236.1 hypothetical protein Xekj_00514 [Xenorhabdus sp. KJ12.1]
MNITVKQSNNLNELQSLLQQRFNTMLGSLMPEFADKTKVSNALVLPDNELFELLYSTALERGARTPERELLKLKRRAENLSAFYKEIERIGGVIKVGDVAEILGITRQAVNLRVQKNKLIAFKKNSDHVFPAFQFKDGRLLPHFEDIMKTISSDIGPVSRISFLTTPLSDKDGKGKTPLDIMKEDSSTDDIAKIFRAAKQLGEQIAS